MKLLGLLLAFAPIMTWVWLMIFRHEYMMYRDDLRGAGLRNWQGALIITCTLTAWALTCAVLINWKG